MSWRLFGVALVSFEFRSFCVINVGQYTLLRGRMYTLASPWHRSSIPWAPLLLHGRRGIIYPAKGSDVRPGVSRVSGVPLASF